MNLLKLEDAAAALGYSAKGLRKIVERSRAKACGARTRGPTIKFFQPAKGSPIRFKQEWLDEFIERHTIDPTNSPPPPKSRKRGKVALDF